MSRLLILVIIILVIGYLWYQWQERMKASERKIADERRLRAPAASEQRASLAAATAPALPLAATIARADAPPPIPGRIQDAADAAAAVHLETATDQMEDLAADLAAARAKADIDAAHLASQADEALAEVQAAAAEEETRFAAARAAADSSLNGEPIVAEEIVIAGSDNGQDGFIIDAVLIDEPENGRRFDSVTESMAADAGGVPPGAVRGDGGRDCPSSNPIKGNRSSMRFHEPGTATYGSTIPEFCFSSMESATAAGYSPTRR